MIECNFYILWLKEAAIMRSTYLCAGCGDEICFDEDCWDIKGVIYCKACIEDCRVSAPMPEEEK